MRIRNFASTSYSPNGRVGYRHFMITRSNPTIYIGNYNLEVKNNGALELFNAKAFPAEKLEQITDVTIKIVRKYLGKIFYHHLIMNRYTDHTAKTITIEILFDTYGLSKGLDKCFKHRLNLFQSRIDAGAVKLELN